MLKILTIMSLLMLPMSLFSKEPQSGELLFPTKGNIDFDKGTYEVWFCLEYSFTQSMMLNDRSHAQPMTFLQMVNDEGWSLDSLSTKKKGSYQMPGIDYLLRASESGKCHGISFSSNIFLRKAKNGKKITGYIAQVDNPVGKLGWVKGDWHFLAITWEKTDKGFEASMTMDGGKPKKAEFVKNPGVDVEKSFNNLIRIGNRFEAWATVNAFRISNRVRSEKEIQDSFMNGLKSDEDTLLYHDGETLSKLKKIRIRYDKKGKPKTKKGKIKVHKDGVIHGYYKIVPGKFGKAIKLLSK